MRRATAASPGVSLFPFLAVLLCTMGALVVVLVVINRQTRQKAVAAAEQDAAHDEQLAIAEEQLALQVSQLTKARDKTRTAQSLVGGKRKKVKNALHKASRKIVGFNFRVRSRTGRRLIPETKRTALLALGEPILADMRTLLKSL